MNAKELGNMPAYPTPGQDCVYASDGLTKREAFAMAAMQGAAASSVVYNSFELAAKDAFRMADAMLAEAAKDQP